MVGVAFRLSEQRPRPEEVDFAAQWLACVYPCQRFTYVLTDIGA